MAQNSGFVPQITLIDFAESYTRKKGFKHYRARAFLWVIYELPTLHSGSFQISTEPNWSNISLIFSMLSLDI